MPLSNEEYFKFGFFKRCAQENLSDAQIAAKLERLAVLLEKQADGSWLNPLAWGGKALELAKAVPDLAGTYVATPLMYGMGAGAVAGGVGGHMLAKMREGTLDPEDVKQQELIAAYNAYAEQVAQRNKLRRQSEQVPGRSYGR